jgi:hypothetical protein
MPTYKIEQYEIHVQKYSVKADDEAAAILAVLDGAAHCVDAPEYIETDDARGLPTDDLDDETLGKLEEGGFYR